MALDELLTQSDGASMDPNGLSNVSGSTDCRAPTSSRFRDTVPHQSTEPASPVRGDPVVGHVTAKLEELLPDGYRRDSWLMPTEKLLTDVVKLAVKFGNATMGNLQLFDRETGVLRIRAQRGFASPFLTFFEAVRINSHTSCGAAFGKRACIAVENVKESLVFADRDTLAALLNAGVHACLSAPLVRGDQIIGALSVHYDTTHRFLRSETDLIRALGEAVPHLFHPLLANTKFDGTI